jgi:hypothetical protein
MAVQDEQMYGKWKDAVQELDMRQRFHDEVVRKYPPTHLLVKDVEAKLAAAKAAYEKVVSEL